MLRFYTLADRKRSFLDLYRIKSVEDYIDSISKLNIDDTALKEQKNIHPDYEFIEDYISNLIDKAGRVCFLGVFDLVKEAFFINILTKLFSWAMFQRKPYPAWNSIIQMYGYVNRHYKVSLPSPMISLL